jgi:hypothetical protein
MGQAASISWPPRFPVPRRLTPSSRGSFRTMFTARHLPTYLQEVKEIIVSVIARVYGNGLSIIRMTDALLVLEPY